MVAVVRLRECGCQTATPKAIHAPCASGIASLVICWHETGGSAESTDTWPNSLSAYRLSRASPPRSKLAVCQADTKRRPSPRLDSHVHAGQTGQTPIFQTVFPNGRKPILQSVSQTKQIAYVLTAYRQLA